MSAKRSRKVEQKYFELVANKNEREIRAAYQKLFSEITSQLSIDDMEEVVRSNSPQKLFKKGGVLAVLLNRFGERVKDIFYKNGVLFSKVQTKALQLIVPKKFVVFTASPYYKAAFGGLVNEKILSMTTGISANSINVFKQIIADGRLENKTVQGIAKDLRLHMTLSERQSRALLNYEKIITSRGSHAKAVLTNADATPRMVLTAKNDLKKLSGIGQIMSQKSSQMAALRAETIARTETGSFLNGVKFEQYKEVNREDSTRTYLKEWLCIGDDRTRENHVFLGTQYGPGRGIPVDDYFRGMLGNVLHPLDPGADPGDTIDCRCTLVLVPK